MIPYLPFRVNDPRSCNFRTGPKPVETFRPNTLRSRSLRDAFGEAVHGWHATAYSNGKRRVYVTFEEVKTVGN